MFHEGYNTAGYKTIQIIFLKSEVKKKVKLHLDYTTKFSLFFSLYLMIRDLITINLHRVNQSLRWKGHYTHIKYNVTFLY